MHNIPPRVFFDTDNLKLMISWMSCRDGSQRASITKDDTPLDDVEPVTLIKLKLKEQQKPIIKVKGKKKKKKNQREHGHRRLEMKRRTKKNGEGGRDWCSHHRRRHRLRALRLPPSPPPPGAATAGSRRSRCYRCHLRAQPPPMGPVIITRSVKTAKPPYLEEPWKKEWERTHREPSAHRLRKTKDTEGLGHDK
uniref:Uncharacterized protein n=1 Tax=Oryza nivara TaxID=4536 RepID=A0A0E0G3V2_ORYNI